MKNEDRIYRTVLIAIVLGFIGVSANTNVVVASEVEEPTAWNVTPQPVTSFGAKVLGDHLYILGGHIGESHDYAPDTTLATFYRISLKGGGAWEELPEAVSSQGVRLIVDEDTIYRVAGMRPVATEGNSDVKLVSLDDFASYQPGAKEWNSLPGLPEPRSSHEAVLVGDRLFVVGGWLLNGKSREGVWKDTMYSIDLSASELKWETHAQPFKRRAISVATDGSRIYCMGGMGESDNTSDEVNIYDVSTGEWSKGPDIPRTPMKGFGSAACSIGDRVVLSPYGRTLWTLSDSGDAWEEVGQLQTNRFFHRIVAVDENTVAAIAGASRSRGHLDSVEWVNLNW